MPQNIPTVGPFTEYLTEPVYPQQQPQPSGWQGGGTTALMLVDNFLRGVSRGRRANFEQEELKRAQWQQNLRGMADFIQNRQDLTRDAKQGALNEIAQALFTEGRVEMAQSKNPLAKIFDQVVGPAPKKMDDATRFQTLSGLMTGLQDPNNLLDRQRMASDYVGGVSGILDEVRKVKGGQPVFAEDITSHPKFVEQRNKLVYEQIDPTQFDSQIFDTLRAAGVPKRAEPGSPAALQQGAIMRLQVGSGQPPAATGGVVDKTPEPPSDPNSGKLQFPQFSPTSNPPAAPRRKLTDDEKILGKASEAQNYTDLDTGKGFMGAMLTDALGNRQIIDVSTNEVVPNARQALASDIKRATPEQVDLKRKEYEKLLPTIFKDKTTQESVKAVVDQYLNSGDIDRADAAFERASSAEERRRFAEDAAAERRVFAQRLTAGTMNTQQATIFNGIVGKYNANPVIQAADKLPLLEQSVKDLQVNPGSAAEQLKMIYGFIKAIDLYDSTVREGEVRLAQMVQSWIGSIENAITRIDKGQIITPEAARELARSSINVISTIKQAADNKRKAYGAQAAINGLGPQWQQYEAAITAGAPSPAPPAAPSANPNPPAPPSGGRQNPYRPRPVPVDY